MMIRNTITFLLLINLVPSHGFTVTGENLIKDNNPAPLEEAAETNVQPAEASSLDKNIHSQEELKSAAVDQELVDVPSSESSEYAAAVAVSSANKAGDIFSSTAQAVNGFKKRKRGNRTTTKMSSSNKTGATGEKKKKKSKKNKGKGKFMNQTVKVEPQQDGVVVLSLTRNEDFENNSFTNPNQLNLKIEVVQERKEEIIPQQDQSEIVEVQPLSPESGSSVSGCKLNKSLTTPEPLILMVDESLVPKVDPLISTAFEPLVLKTEEPLIGTTNEPVVLKTEEPLIAATNEQLIPTTDQAPLLTSTTPKPTTDPIPEISTVPSYLAVIIVPPSAKPEQKETVNIPLRKGEGCPSFTDIILGTTATWTKLHQASGFIDGVKVVTNAVTDSFKSVGKCIKEVFVNVSQYFSPTKTERTKLQNSVEGVQEQIKLKISLQQEESGSGIELHQLDEPLPENYETKTFNRKRESESSDRYTAPARRRLG